MVPNKYEQQAIKLEKREVVIGFIGWLAIHEVLLIALVVIIKLANFFINYLPIIGIILFIGNIISIVLLYPTNRWIALGAAGGGTVPMVLLGYSIPFS